MSSGTSIATVVSTGASTALSQAAVIDTGTSSMVSQGLLVSTGISSEVSLGVKVSTTMSSVQSAIVAQGGGLSLPDILVDFGTTNITNLGQLRAAFNDMFERAKSLSGLT